MSKAIILRTKDDGRIWLISFDRPTISEISASTARGLDLPVTEVETFAAAGNVRPLRRSRRTSCNNRVRRRVASARGVVSRYFDRVRAPAETLAAMRPRLAEFGITAWLG